MAQPQPPASPAPAQARSSMPPPAAPAQPYPAYAYPAYPPVAPARQLPYDKNWFRAKLVLTGLSLVWCIILLSLALALTFHQFDDFYASPLAAYWCLPLVIPTAIWDIAELVTVCACGKRHGNKQGIHPGAHVGVDLVIWLASLLCVLFSTSAVILMASDMRYCSDRSSSADYYGYYCDGVQEYGKLMSLTRAILAFVCLLTITHFIIFVRACVETNQRNRSRHAAVIMVPAPQMPMPMYYGGVDPRMSMAPPQLEKGGAAPAPAPAPAPEGYSNLAGFYAPAGPMPTQPAPARHAQGNSGETAAPL